MDNRVEDDIDPPGKAIEGDGAENRFKGTDWPVIAHRSSLVW
jgi:hypothetical protein